MGTEVARKNTPVAVADAARLVVQTLTHLLGVKPTRQLAEFVLALVWVETGRGKAVQNNSPGNVMARGIRNGAEYSVWNGDYWRPTWYDPQWSNAAMKAGQAPSAFRSYASLEAGFLDALTHVTKRSPLVAAAQSGDPMRFAVALRDTKYSPDYGPQHAKTFRGLVAEFRKLGLFSELPSSSGSGAGAVVAVLGVLCVGCLVAWRLHA